MALLDEASAGGSSRKTRQQISRTVGDQIRELRRLKRVTIAELAKRIGKSIGYVSQIERNISTVSISALQEIGDALGVPINWFFQTQAAAPDDEGGFVVRKAHRRRLEFTGSRITEELLSPHLNGQLELILTTVEPGGSTGDKDRVRRGEDAGYVIEGSIELWVDDKHVTLDTGDAFAFTRVGPHRCVNSSKNKAVILWVLTPPSY